MRQQDQGVMSSLASTDDATPRDTLSRQITIDAMFSGAIRCCQNKNGYRFSIDAVLAAHFQPPRPGECILDLGAGCGIIGMIMMYRWTSSIDCLHALEYQPQLCNLIEANFTENGFDNRCQVIHGDVKHILDYVEPESYSLVVCNPPYYQAHRGRMSGNDESSIARHLIAAELGDFVRAAAVAVKNGGTVVFIFPADLFSQLSGLLCLHRLEIKEMQAVYSYPIPRSAARLILLKCIKNGGVGMRVLPPFYIYSSKNGPYSEEMQRLYDP